MALSPWEALEMVWDVLFAIAIPTILFALGGRWLDTRFHTSPLFTILGLVLAVLIAGIIVWRKAKDIGKRLDQ